ncbi:hypothetical protein COT97_04795 [Candidatus Falkowbacteria bacterium CG10_big_fil_rev_8_21_14_0_10_39_11]|uniref:AI-2E family transporter n=1 Tax=Candidatus Falkowbacteria bacterium CG10_big_fil_rev_8_21_14_0_10_39_11 TaxID=1974565 RepID=A0A2H0V3W4_9BACT|nr:MAG: hypothetical protein COT97_04795 [Candidatus Falkowbacteria bacterium CG10_big_fil_rev_8_21_14_0_10_39_11]
MMEKPEIVMNISLKSIMKFLAIGVVLFLVYYFRDLLALLFVALILSTVLRPGVRALQQIKFPKTLSILLFYIVFLFLVGLVLSLFIPIVIDQSASLVESVSTYYNEANVLVSKLYSYTAEFGQAENLQKAIDLTREGLSVSAKSLFLSLPGIFGGIFSLIILLVLTFYLLIEEDAVKKALMTIVPSEYQSQVNYTISRMQLKISSWFKGQVVLSFLISLLVYVGLTILGVEYALVLALLAFFGEFIPYVGPFFAALPAILISLFVSPLLALFTALLFILIQQIENHVLVPKVMQKAVGLNPIICILALLIGARVASVIGVILAIPVATAFVVLIEELPRYKKN